MKHFLLIIWSINQYNNFFTNGIPLQLPSYFFVILNMYVNFILSLRSHACANDLSRYRRLLTVQQDSWVQQKLPVRCYWYSANWGLCNIKYEELYRKILWHDDWRRQPLLGNSSINTYLWQWIRMQQWKRSLGIMFSAQSMPRLYN
jgi:hypothetical protein